MPAGRLDSLVSLLSPPVGTDALGQPVVGAFVLVAKVWADIKHPSGLETVRGDVQVSITQASIRIRRRAGVLPSWRIQHGDVVYEIKAVPPSNLRSPFMDLPCQVVT